MYNARIIVRNHQIVRTFCATSVKNKHSPTQAGKFLTKLMHGGRKRKWYDNNERTLNLSLPGTKRVPSTHVVRRMTVLNKLFMKHITDLMSTGEASTQLLQRDIEVSRVEVTPDFKFVNVFWIDNNQNLNPTEKSTEDILRDCAMRLRHELSQLRVIGVVPPIQFVKCKHSHLANEIEKRLKIADYGDDFQPSIYPHTPNTTIKNVESKNNEEKEEKLDSEGTENAVDVENSVDTFCVTLPLMRNDVFGIDHHKIMSKIKSSLSKSRNAVARLPDKALNIDVPRPLDNIPKFPTKKEQQEEFSNFLIQQKKNERRKRRMMRWEQKQSILNIDTEEFDSDYDTSYEIEYGQSDEEEDVDDFEDEL